LKAKPQIRWAIVGYRDLVHSAYIAHSRKAVIERVLSEHRSYSSPRVNGEGLTDAQFWRRIKRRRNYTVRRIKLTVVR